MTTVGQDVFSPCYDYCKFYRKELKDLLMIPNEHNRKKDYGFYFLVLLSHAICENVDLKNTIRMNGEKPNFYLPLDEMMCAFGLSKASYVVKILEVLKNSFGAIDYCVKPCAINKNNVNNLLNSNIYVHINICNQFIPRGNYDKTNEEHYANVLSSKNNEGFFFVNKQEFFDVFYKNSSAKHGAKDFYCLLRLNTSYRSRAVLGCVPKRLFNSHVVIWKCKGDSLYTFAPYYNQESLSRFLNISSKTMSRHFKTLSKYGFVENAYLNKRGTFVRISYLDNIIRDATNVAKSDAKLKARELIRSIYEYRDKINFNVGNNDMFKYSFYKIAQLFLNIVNYRTVIHMSQ